jgi:hypothetical protein
MLQKDYRDRPNANELLNYLNNVKTFDINDRNTNSLNENVHISDDENNKK